MSTDVCSICRGPPARHLEENASRVAWVSGSTGALRVRICISRYKKEEELIKERKANRMRGTWLWPLAKVLLAVPSAVPG
jgi:hypothetical protein